MKYRIKEIVRSDKSVFIPQESCLGWFWNDCLSDWGYTIEFATLDKARAWLRAHHPEVYGVIIHEA